MGVGVGVGVGGFTKEAQTLEADFGHTSPPPPLLIPLPLSNGLSPMLLPDAYCDPLEAPFGHESRCPPMPL